MNWGGTNRTAAGVQSETQSYLTRMLLRLLGLWEGVVAAKTQNDLAIRKIIPGDRVGERICHPCIFVHFDKDGIVDPHVLYHLESLRSIGRDIIVVTNAPSLNEGSLAALRPLCHEIILRENRGYDFGAWKTGLSRIGDEKEAETLILANDSVYGPFFDLSAIIEKMRSGKADFWGITDSLELEHHIQSYFVFFERRVFESEAFRDFWQNLPLYSRKLAVIWVGEIGLPRKLRQAGFHMGAACPTEELNTLFPRRSDSMSSPTRGAKINPTRAFWKQLIQTLGCPFLKVDIVRDQTASVDGIDDWRSVVEASTDYDPNLIQQHVDRVRKATSSAE